MKSFVNRRAVLRSTTATIALPLLESLRQPRRAAAAAASPPPKRLVFLGFGWGVTAETWFPDKKQIGREYPLPPGLAPLARHKNSFSLLQGMQNRFTVDPHFGSTFWLTGANRYAQPGKTFANTISVDQVAAAVLGKETRYPSLELDSSSPSGHGPGLSMAWDARGKPLAGLTTPVLAFHKLFSAETTPLEQRQRMLREGRSVIDALRADARRLEHSLSAVDADKLDEYLQSIRDIETQIAREEQWLTTPKPTVTDIREPDAKLQGREEVRVMYDLLVAALRTDSTRVVTYRQPVDTLIKSIGITVAGHDMSHYRDGESRQASEKRDLAQSELLAELLDKLAAARDPDGSSLLDTTCVVYGSNIRAMHHLDNCPTLVAGGGAGIRLGENIVLPDKTPLCNLWLTLLDRVGAKADAIGDSTRTLDEVLA
ncbi:MAG: DUF1552 domain-containing protein [Pirellulales bacterium]